VKIILLDQNNDVRLSIDDKSAKNFNVLVINLNYIIILMI